VLFRSIDWVSASSSATATPTLAISAACSNRSTNSVGAEAFTLERAGFGFGGGVTGTCCAAVASVVSRGEHGESSGSLGQPYVSPALLYSLDHRPGHRLVVDELTALCPRQRPASVPRRGERRTDRRAAKAVWILELPGRSGTIHLMHHCPGFACSCHDLKTSGAVHKSFIVKLSANWLSSNCCAAQHDSEY
jgi:hypothetical protein